MTKPEKKICGANTRGGKPCRRAAGAGTDHLGFGRCSLHAGSTPNGEVAAAREQAAEYALTMAGDGEPIDPHEVMERLVWMAWYQVEFCRAKVRALDEGAVVVRPTRQGSVPIGGNMGSELEEFKQEETLNLWIHELHAAMERAAKISATAIKAGIEERRVQVAERYGETIARLIDGILTDLALSKDQASKAPQIVKHHLNLVTQGSAA